MRTMKTVPVPGVRRQTGPDFWFVPEYVVEVPGSEITRSPLHTCGWDDTTGRGLALRFPRFIRWRPEKDPEQATGTEEIAQMYRDRPQDRSKG